MESWVAQSAFKYRRGTNIFPSEITYKCHIPKARNYDIKSLNAQISLHTNLNESYDLFSHLEVEKRNYLTLSPNEPQAFNWYIDNIFILQDFLTVAVGRPVQPRIITGRPDAKLLDDSEKHPVSVDVYFQLLGPKPDKNIHPTQMVLPLPRIDDFFEELLDGWFDKSNILRPVYGLLFSASYHVPMTGISYFLTLWQAMEVLHDRAVNPEKENDTAKNKIKLLVNNVWEECLEYFIRGKDEFCNKAVNTRHYYTHYAIKKQRLAATGQELYKLSERLRIIVYANLLKIIDLNNDFIFQSFKERYGWLVVKRPVKSNPNSSR